MNKCHWMMVGLLIGPLLCSSGCGSNPGGTVSDPKSAVGESSVDHRREGHGHGAGPHDGVLVDWGGGKFHAEFTVDHEKQEATVYILGNDEKTPVPIKADEIQLSIQSPAVQVALKAVSREGEPEGSSSRFVGSHQGLGVVQEYQGTISGVVDDTPYAGDFKEEPHDEHAD